MNKKDSSSKLCAFIDKEHEYFDNYDYTSEQIKEMILANIKKMYEDSKLSKKDFRETILHKDRENFGSMNIMTLFVVGLLQVGSSTFSGWIESTDTEYFRDYVLSFLYHINTKLQIKVLILSSTPEEPARPKDDRKIPETLCITDSKKIIGLSPFQKTFVLDMLEEEKPWNMRVSEGDTITSLSYLWYVYVLWYFRDDNMKIGCYGIEFGQNCYFFAYNLVGSGTPDADVDKRKHDLIDVPYQAYISCMKKTEMIPDEVISKLDSLKFKYNMLLYVHLLVLGHFNNDKIIFYVCHEYMEDIKDALLAGRTYGDFYNKLQIAGDGLMIQPTPETYVIEALAFAHWNLMTTKPYIFSSEIPRPSKRMRKDMFITTCPVDYQWVFEDERLVNCEDWKMKMITLIQKIITGQGSFTDVSIIRRIIDCIQNKESYDEDMQKYFGMFRRSVDIGVKVKTSESDEEEKYIVFDIGAYGEKYNLFHFGNGIDRFCHNEVYKEAMKQYFKFYQVNPSIKPHFNDFKYKYVVWDKQKNNFYVRDSSEMALVNNKLSKSDIDAFPFCPFCKEGEAGNFHQHIRKSHTEEFKKLELELKVTIPKRLEPPGGKTQIQFGVDGDKGGTSGTNGVDDAPVYTPGMTPGTAKTDYSYSSENEEQFKAEWAQKHPNLTSTSEEIKASGQSGKTGSVVEGSGGSNQKGKLKPIKRSQSEASMDVKKNPKNNRPLSAAETRTGVVVDERFAHLEPSANPPPPDAGAAGEKDAASDSGGASPTGSTADSQKTTDAGVTSSVVGSTEGTPRQALPDDVQEDMPEDAQGDVPDPVTPTPTPDPTEDGTSRKPRPSTAKRTQATRTTFVEAEDSPRDGGEGEVDDLNISNRTTQGNDEEEEERLKRLLKIRKRIREERKEHTVQLENEKNELIAQNTNLRDNINDLNQTIQRMTEEINKQSQEHVTKIQALSGEKDKEIAELKIQLTQTTSQEIKALGLAKDVLERQNDGIKQEIRDNKALLESIKREIKDNERKKDQNMAKIDEQIDAMYDMDIDDSELKFLLQDRLGKYNADDYVEFKNIVLDEHPVKETHSLCALFLMYESMAGTWKAFVEQREQKKIDNVIVQKLMHELRLYSSIANHNDTVKGLVSKHFKEFVGEFKLEAGAGATVAEQVQSVQAVAGPAPASVEPEADTSAEPAASDSEEGAAPASEEEAAPASEEPAASDSEEGAAPASEEEAAPASEEPEADTSAEPVAATGDPGDLRAI